MDEMEELGCSLFETYKTLEVIGYRLTVSNGAPFHIISAISSTTNLYVWTGAMNSILTIQTYNYQLISRLHTYTNIQSYMFVGWRCQSKNQVHWWTFTFLILFVGFVGQNVHPTPSQVLRDGRSPDALGAPSSYPRSSAVLRCKLGKFSDGKGWWWSYSPFGTWDFCFTPMEHKRWQPEKEEIPNLQAMMFR